MITIASLVILSIVFFSDSILGDFDESFYKNWVNKYREISGNQNPPLKYKDWIKLASNLNCTTDPANYKQIFEDLKDYKKMNLSVAKLQELSEKVVQYGVDVSRKQKNIFLKTRLLWPFQNSLAYLSRLLDPMIDFYVITNVYDEGIVAPADDNQGRPYSDMADLVSRSEIIREAHKEYIDSNMFLRAPSNFIAVPFDIPIFSVNRLKGFKDIILPTVRTALTAYPSQYKVAMSAPAWENKNKKAVFRGRTTGVNFRKVREENIPLTQNVRFKLHDMSMKQKEGQLYCSVPLDFGLTDIWQCDEGNEYIEEITKKFPLVPSLEYEIQFKSKYLIVVDGNGWPDRLATFLLSGSLVFLATVHEEWVINQIVDGEHYIKVKPDLSDLVDKLEWAAANDEEAKRIAMNGRQFSKKMFDSQPMQMYNSFLFMEYQRLFK